MIPININDLDLAPLWAWVVIFTRLSGLFYVLPGIGTDQVPIAAKFSLAFALATALTFTGMTCQLPESLGVALLTICCQFVFGYLLGTLPSLVLDGLAIAGQLTAASIGLAQANTIDPSIGQNVTVLSHFKTMFATLIFLVVNGHHAIIKAATVGLNGLPSQQNSGSLVLSLFYPSTGTSEFLLAHFSEAFDLAIVVSAPIIATVLLTQFALGLITKFIPQVNIFIVSMPLSVLVGIYIFTFSIPELSHLIIENYNNLQNATQELWSTSSG